MLPDFTNSISWATILAVFGWVVTGGAQSYNLGRRTATNELKTEQNRADLAALAARVETAEKASDQRAASVTGAQSLLRDQFAEFRQTTSERYVPREQIEAIERRVTSNQDRILERLDKISERVERLVENMQTHRG